MAGGFAAAILAIRYMFDVTIKEEIFVYIFALSATIVGPIYALSLMPKRFNLSAAECLTLVNVEFLTSWILAPLAII